MKQGYGCDQNELVIVNVLGFNSQHLHHGTPDLSLVSRFFHQTPFSHMAPFQTLRWFSQHQIEHMNVTPENVDLISITSPGKQQADINKDLFDHVFRVEFRDDDESFNESHAQQILDFITNSTANHLYCHCLMGRSRSVAVIRALADITDHDVQTPRSWNAHVYRTLIRTWNSDEKIADYDKLFS